MYYSITQCFSTAFASGHRYYIDPTLYGTKIICLYKSKDSLKSSTRVLNITMYCIDCTLCKNINHDRLNIKPYKNIFISHKELFILNFCM